MSWVAYSSKVCFNTSIQNNWSEELSIAGATCFAGNYNQILYIGNSDGSIIAANSDTVYTVDSLPIFSILSMLVDNKGTLYVGTGNSIYRLESGKLALLYFTNKNCYKLKESENGNILGILGQSDLYIKSSDESLFFNDLGGSNIYLLDFTIQSNKIYFASGDKGAVSITSKQ